MGADRRWGAIVLEVFRRVSISVVELRNFDLVGVRENHRWSDDGTNLFLIYLLHCFQFIDVTLEVRLVGQYYGYIFG